MNTTQFVTLQAMYTRFHDALIRAQQERLDRQDIVNGEVEWVTYERTVMLNAVNEARAERGYQPIDIAAIERVENKAAGHFDYTKKWALYCTELVHQEQQ